MSRILLISSNLFARPYPVYPLGMAVIASALSEQGRTVRQFDSISGDGPEERLRAAVREFGPDFVGVSIRNIDDENSFSSEKSWCLERDKRLVSLVRECTDAPVILGGAGFSIMPEEILAFLGADYGVVGEGERAICALIEGLEKGFPPAAAIMRQDAPLKGMEMRTPLWEKALVEFYITRSGMINLQTKRGCPYNCSYCVYPSLEGRRFRRREPGAVIDEIKTLQAVYNVDTVFFTDSVFNDPDGGYLELAEEIIRSGVKVRWTGYFRPRGTGYAELSLLKRSGLYAMEIGTDSGCDETLAAMQKGFTFDDVAEFNSACVRAEIPGAHFVIFGVPGETEKTVNEGLKNIGMLKKSIIFAYSGLRILPGTSLHRRAVRDGVISRDQDLLRPIYYFSPDMDVETMNRTIEEESRNYRGFIFPPDRGDKMIAAMNALGHRGLLWDRLITFFRDGERRKRKG